MSDYNYRKGDGFLSVDRFGGIDLRARGALRPDSARTSVNFRYSPSLGLVPRGGFYKIASGGEIRGFYSFSLSGKEYLVYASGSTLYSLTVSASGTVSRKNLGKLPASTGEVKFFIYDSKLYILDGYDVFAFDGKTLAAAPVYVPLMYRREATVVPYTACESANMVTSRGRVRFAVTTTQHIYYMPEAVTGVLRVVSSSGKEVSFFEDTSTDTVFIELDSYPSSSDTYEAECVMDTSGTEKPEFSGAAVFGRVTTQRVYLFSASEYGRVYYSTPPDKSYSAYGSEYDGAQLFFSPEASFLVGQGEQAVTAACRFLDRLFIFTASDAWFVSAASPGEASPLHSNVGCAISDGALPLDNNPLTVGRDGLYLWNRVTGYSECSAEFSSGAIASVLTPEVIASSVAGVCPGHDEVWICPGADLGGGAYIWDFRRDIFYRFEGFCAERIAPFCGEMAFVWDGGVYLFSPELTADSGHPDGRAQAPVTAVWENTYCPFNGYPEKKRLHRAAFTVFPDGGTVTLTVRADNGREVSRDDGGVIAAVTDPSVPLTFEARAGAGNFYTAKLRLTAVGGRSEISSAALGVEVL